MSDRGRRSEEEREAARLERERKRTGSRPPDVPQEPKKPEQVKSGNTDSTTVGAGPPRAASPPPAPARPVTPRPAAPTPAASPAAPRKVTDPDERPSGTIRPGSPKSGNLDAPAAVAKGRRRSPGRHALLFGVVAVVLAALLFFANGIFEPFSGAAGAKVKIKIPQGVNAGDVGTLLADNGVVASPFFFELRATLGGDRGNLRAGEYELQKGMTNSAALAALTNVAKGAAVIDVLVPEGPSRPELAKVVARQGVKGSYVNASKSSPVLDPRKYGAPSNVQSLEGFLFPATYELLKKSPTAKRLVNDQLTAFKQNFATLDLSYARSKNLTGFDVVILASIIEREALFDQDRPLVAAVFYNRLRQSISLGSDATTRFAVDNWDQPLTVSELANSSRYNTRRFAGMPPGPIGNPGLASLKAAANPPKSSDLFFIIEPCRKGRLTFAKTAAQFQTMIDAYNNQRAAEGGKDPAFCRKK